MATKRYDNSTRDHLVLMRDKAETIFGWIRSLQTENDLLDFTKRAGVCLGEMCQLHIVLSEIAAAIASGSERAHAEAERLASGSSKRA